MRGGRRARPGWGSSRWPRCQGSRKQRLGYTIKNGSRFVEVDAADLFDNGAQIQVWEANLPLGGHAPNQV